MSLGSVVSSQQRVKNMNEVEVNVAGCRFARAHHIVAVLAVASLFVLVGLPQAAGAQVPQPPPNGNCEGVAVVVKLGVVEDRAAANMLAEAAAALGLGERCLVDAGDPRAGSVTSGSRSELSSADRVFVVGGPAAIPDSWLSSQLGVSGFTRIAGGNRWETQSAVAAAIINLARGEPVTAYSGQPASSPDLPVNTGCTNAVLVNQNVEEDTAAANMLAETFSYLSADGNDRCLIDVGDPQSGISPTRSAKNSSRDAVQHHVIGGTAAIPNSWLRTHFNNVSVSRLAGANRWATQEVVAASIVSVSRNLPTDPVLEATFDQNVSTKSQINLSDITVHVYYCGAGSRGYGNTNLEADVESLNRIVPQFFARESSGLTRMRFTAGTVLTPNFEIRSNWTWTTLTLADWAEPNNREWEGHAEVPSLDGVDPCQQAAIDHAKVTGISRQQILVLMDAKPDGVSGYAWTDLGPATVALSDHFGRNVNYLATVAHELGHSVYGWKHPWDAQDFVDPDWKRKDANGDRLAASPVPTQHIAGFEHDLRALMSWNWPQWGGRKQDLSENASTADAAYLSCFDRHQQDWVEFDKQQGQSSCDELPPNPPSAAELSAGNRSIVVEWLAPSSRGSAVTRYEIEYTDDSSQGWIRRSTMATERRIELTGLSNDVAYHVRVRARNIYGPSAWSSVIHATPRGSGEFVVAVQQGPFIGNSSVCDGQHCGWVHISLSSDLEQELGPGPHSLACAHDGIDSIGQSRGVYESHSVTTWPSERHCKFEYPGAQVFAIVGAELRDGVWYGGYYSQSITWNARQRQRSSGHINDNPTLADNKAPYTWWEPPSDVDAEGYGENGFRFTLAVSNNMAVDNSAEWDFGSIADDTYRVEAWIPARWATAEVQYRIYDDGNLVAAPWINQSAVSGWVSLGSHRLSGRVTVEIDDITVRDDYRDDGVIASRLAVDAIRLEVDDGTSPIGPPPPDGSELMVRRGNIKIDGRTCLASTGCRWVVGSGSGWPAGDQFWVKCGNFVDTSRNIPVIYRDRFVDAGGNLSWGESICYSAGSHAVEVWTSSGARKVVTIR